MVLVGNKTDLEGSREVSTVDAEAFAKETEMGFVETSAKELYNVDGAFDHIVEEILKQRPDLAKTSESGNGKGIKLEAGEHTVVCGSAGIKCPCS